jgi:hypothetical protein
MSDETLQEQYMSLIDRLMKCPNDQEPKVLDERSELLDAEFVQTVVQLDYTFAVPIEALHPPVAHLLRRCHMKAIASSWGKPPKPLLYLCIYCPELAIAAVKGQQVLLRSVAYDLGLSEVICINAHRLLRDPLSSLRQIDSRLWLELQWLTSRDRDLG